MLPSECQCASRHTPGGHSITTMHQGSRSRHPRLEKLKRVLQYLRGTLDDVMRLGADSLFEMKTWVDASYAVHPIMKSHTGGCISFKIDVLLAMGTKQKLNTKRSTEAKVVGASDYLANCIWTRMFMEAQGYKMKVSRLQHEHNSFLT